jgi:polysaccharide biosynthesis/export protein
VKRILFLFAVLCANMLLINNSFAQAYTLNPGDVLDISIWGEKRMQRQVKVLPDGKISYPLAGHIQVLGLTPEAVEKILVEKLTKFLSNPVVSLAVVKTDGYKFFVIGQVKKAGVYYMARPITIVQAISLAGGFTPYAEKDEVFILRNTEGITTKFIFDYTLLETEDFLKSDILIEVGDTIIVP